MTSAYFSFVDSIRELVPGAYIDASVHLYNDNIAVKVEWPCNGMYRSVSQIVMLRDLRSTETDPMPLVYDKLLAKVKQALEQEADDGTDKD